MIGRVLPRPPKEAGGDEAAGRQGERQDAVLGVVGRHARLMARQEAGQRPGGLGEVEDSDDEQQQADEDGQARGELFCLQMREFLPCVSFFEGDSSPLGALFPAASQAKGGAGQIGMVFAGREDHAGSDHDGGQAPPAPN